VPLSHPAAAPQTSSALKRRHEDAARHHRSSSRCARHRAAPINAGPPSNTLVYSDYSRDKIGWFFGLTGAQFAFLGLASLPFFWAVRSGAWVSGGLFLLIDHAHLILPRPAH
jgi:hypothetical protein